MATFTVMTWNVENLFPIGHQDSNSRRAVSAEDFNAKLQYLSQRIQEFNPDVVALQEIGAQSCLDDLTEALGAPFTHSRLSAHPDRRGIAVALISQHALHDLRDWHDFPSGALQAVPDWPSGSQDRVLTRMGRGALSATVRIAGVNIRVVTAHLKSKLVTYPNGAFSPSDEDMRTRGAGLALLRRTAEAVAIRANVNATMNEAAGSEHTVLLGDMNDEPQAATSQLLLGPSDEDIDRPDRFDSVRLYNLTDELPKRGQETTALIPAERRFSRRYKGRGEMIDHIYATRTLALNATKVDSVIESIVHENINDSPNERFGKERPDHAPVYAVFEL